MVKESQRSNDLKRSALLRERILGCLRAAPGPMTRAEIAEFSGIVELYHEQMRPQKVGVQLRALVASKDVQRLVRGQYAIAKKPVPVAQPVVALMKALHLEVSVREQTISFQFAGLQFSIKILP